MEDDLSAILFWYHGFNAGRATSHGVIGRNNLAHLETLQDVVRDFLCKALRAAGAKMNISRTLELCSMPANETMQVVDGDAVLLHDSAGNCVIDAWIRNRSKGSHTSRNGSCCREDELGSCLFESTDDLS